jgi:hypothetical protein
MKKLTAMMHQDDPKGVQWLDYNQQCVKIVEPTTGLEPVNLFLTKEVLYLLSYVGPYTNV